MKPREIPMVSIYVYGEEYRVPQVFVDEMIRLRALERQRQGNERRKAIHGPLPPSQPSQWVEVKPL